MATPTSTGNDVLVNSTTANFQFFPAITALKGGGYVVTWDSFGQDGGGFGVFGQRFNTDGSTIGGEFQINTFTANGQSDSSIAALSDGGFVVTWESFAQDGDQNGIYGQRFNADGTNNGVEFHVSNETVDTQTDSAVTGLADGGFMVTWASNLQDTSGYGVYGQRYNADGSVNGVETLINSTVVNGQFTPTITSLADGGFLVAWNSFGQDGSVSGVFAQRYNANGSANGGEFGVNSFTVGDQAEPDVTSLSDGGFIIVWSSSAQDGSLLSVHGQRYNADGSENGGEFQVNSHTPGSQTRPTVTELADGGFVVTWESFNQDAGVNDNGVFGQRYNADGTNNGVEFQINTETAFNQEHPVIVALADGDFVVVWQSDLQDGSAYGVFSKHFSVDLFSAGNDMVYLPGESPAGGWQALGGDDRVLGSDNADTVDGCAGDDYITAGLGNDTVDGGDGSDYLYGQGGDDTINAGAGAMDVSLGDDGNDTINGEAGMDYMYGYAGNDTLRGGAGDDVAYGGTGNDELYGDDGADWLFGEAGNDKLFGGAGADLLMGGAGVDEITGGAGNDWMWGGDMAGAGDGVADTFIFGAAWGGDVIWDFEDGKDMLDVSGAGITSFADLTIGTFGQFTTITSATGDIIYLRGAGDVAIAESSIETSDFIFA